MELRNLAPPEGTFDTLYGLEVTAIDDAEVRGHIDVRPELKQGAGLLHGGVLASMAEALATMATYLAVRDDGKAAMGLSNATSFLRPITEGTIEAVAKRRHRGRTTWVWDVDFTDTEGRLCATTRMTIAVR
ncbi:MAG TPA: PaaI family thioesterase [Solirubrobacteraceae bacterium]|nr:PaaI family thioesterase [Solirubrobacteraceae bacterium]